MRVLLECDEDRLVGFEKGKSLYLLQLSNVLNYKYKVTLLFPSCVTYISLSFIDGFMSEVYKHISKDEFTKYIAIDGDSKVVDKFYKYFSIF